MDGTKANPVIPLACHVETRDGTLSKDALLVNCYIENTDNGPCVIKRPGTVVGATVPTGFPQGLGRHNGHVWAVVDNVLYQVDVTGTPPVITPIPSVTGPTGQQYQVISDVAVGKSGFKSQYGAWIVDGTTITKITDPDYPALTCQGVAWLDGAAYVVELNATSGRNVLRGSDLEAPASWNPLNFIEISTTGGRAVYICNHLNYVAVFLESGLRLFYDAGNAVGSPLAPVQNASWLTGCGSANSVVKIVDDLFFVSRSSVTGYAVTVLSGLTLSTISTPAIERVLNRVEYTYVSAQSFKCDGHSFYCLSGLSAGGVSTTLAFNLTTKTWAQWTSVVGGVEKGFQGINAISKDATYYMQDATDGTMMLLTDTAYTDGAGTLRGTVPINTRVITRPFDWGTLKRKFFSAVYLLADTVAATVSLRYSDDDYSTFSAWRSIDLSSIRKMGVRFGSSRRRSWEFLHTGNTPFRAYGLEIEVEKSTE